MEIIFMSLLIVSVAAFAIATIMLFRMIFLLFDDDFIHTDPSAEYSRKYYKVEFCPHCGAKTEDEECLQVNINGTVKCEKCGGYYNYLHLEETYDK